jgi:uncharacterized protein YdhG (YjbR/CyaY superfamily)
MSLAELIAAAEDADAVALRELLAVTRTLAPQAEEGISYGVAALFHHGKPLLGIGANAKGYAIYPFSAAVVAAVAAELPDFRVSTGAIGFNGAQPIPTPTLVRIIRLRLAELEPSPI